MKKCLIVMFCMLVLTLGLTAGDNKLGLFPACYNIGNAMPGAPLFTVKLMVNAPEKVINSFEGRITQATNPPLDIKTDMHGYYLYATVINPKRTFIVVHLIGYPIEQNVHVDPERIILPNVYLDMVLEEGWEKGTANYQYRGPDGKWVLIEDVPVKSIECWAKKD